MFGLTGSHRSGKTTLAKAVAERTGIPYFDAAVSATMKARGYNTVGDMTFSDRLEMQRMMLVVYTERMLDAPRPAITDRTPLDMAAYTLAELTMHSAVTEKEAEEVAKYLDRCMRMTAQHFDTIIQLRPLPHYEVEPGKPPPNRAYQKHIDILLCGLIEEMPDHCLKLEIPMFDLEQRIAIAEQIMMERIEAIRTAMGSLRLH